MTRLGEYIQERRTHLGLTRADLARELKVHKAEVQRWEEGTWCPRPTTLVALARVLGMPAHELMMLQVEDVEVEP